MSEEDLEKYIFDSQAAEQLDPEEVTKRNKTLNSKVIETACKDLLSSDKKNFLDAIYFLFGGDERSIKEFKQKTTFEAFCERAGLDHKSALSMVWKQIPIYKKKEIQQALKEHYDIELDKNFTIPDKVK